MQPARAWGLEGFKMFQGVVLTISDKAAFLLQCSNEVLGLED